MALARGENSPELAGTGTVKMTARRTLRFTVKFVRPEWGERVRPEHRRERRPARSAAARWKFFRIFEKAQVRAAGPQREGGRKETARRRERSDRQKKKKKKGGCRVALARGENSPELAGTGTVK